MRVGRIVAAVAACVLTLTALALGVARFVESSALAAQLAALAPFGAILAGLGAATFAGLGATGGSRWAIGGLAGAGAIVVAHLWWFAPLVAGGQPLRPPDTASLTVLAANMRRGDIPAGQIVATARRERVDILVLTEITRTALASLEASGLGDQLPYRAGEPARSTSGTMVFLRTPVSEVRRIPMRLGTWEITTTIRNRRLRLLAVHAMPPGQTAQWRRDLALVTEVATARTPDIIAGDLNATRDHPALRRLLGRGYRDAVELVNGGWRPTWPAPGTVRVLGIAVPAFAQIDHILVGTGGSSPGGARRAWTVDFADTDHAAVAAELWLPYAR